MTYLALLRGVNVGGKNTVHMPTLKAALESVGLRDVLTYINSGNVIFDSQCDSIGAKMLCEKTIKEMFGLDIAVCILTREQLRDALAHAPNFWGVSTDCKHNAIFVIPPATAEEIIAEVGAAKSEYEMVAHHGGVIFWSAPLATFSRTRWSKITAHRAAYNAITVRNANTVRRLLELTEGRT